MRGRLRVIIKSARQWHEMEIQFAFPFSRQKVIQSEQVKHDIEKNN